MKDYYIGDLVMRVYVKVKAESKKQAREMIENTELGVKSFSKDIEISGMDYDPNHYITVVNQPLFKGKKEN